VKQRVVALSSCKAEYIAATIGACQGVWLARLLADMTGTAVSVPMLKVDNKSAYLLSRIMCITTGRSILMLDFI
jgi:hypothetical protein